MNVKNLYLFTFGLCLLAATALPVKAAFHSLYVFGDGLSSTTDTNYPGSSQYYGQRLSNGRVWVEVLAQRQGLAYYVSNNNSYFGHNSSETLANVVSSFLPPADVSNALFVVWVCNADTFDSAQVPDNSDQWRTDNIQAQINYSNIIANLYADGVRTLILPNAVDISKIPDFNGTINNSYGSLAATMSAGCVDYNVRFSNTISQARSLPGLTIYAPDFFNLLNNVLTNAAYYGLTNATYQGFSIDAIDVNNFYSSLPPCATNGFGTNFIFWDPDNPTAQLHAIIADEVQKLLPQTVRIGKITPFIGSNRLDVVNMPGGLNGFVEGGTNLAVASWTTNLVGFTSTNTTPSVFVPASGSPWFYRLRIPYYPYSWSWP